MEDRYKIFQKGYNKILDLIENVDEKLIKQYKSFISIIPKEIIKKITRCEDFAVNSEWLNAEMMVFCNSIDFDFTRYENYLKADMSIHRFFDDDLFPKTDKDGNVVEEDPIKIFSLSFRNTPVKQKNVEIYFEQVDNAYKYTGNNIDEKTKGKDIEYEVFLEIRDEKYYIVCRKTSRGVLVYEQEEEFTFDELMLYIEEEDEHEEDLEIEFDADFDISNE